MKKNWELEDGGRISVTRTKPLDERNEHFNYKDPLKM
jgi:hypothetical protein